MGFDLVHNDGEHIDGESGEGGVLVCGCVSGKPAGMFAEH